MSCSMCDTSAYISLPAQTHWLQTVLMLELMKAFCSLALPEWAYQSLLEFSAANLSLETPACQFV